MITPEFTPIFSGVRVTRYLVLYVCFVDRCLSFCTFSFGPCIVCSSSIYRFWLPLWYLQTLLSINSRTLSTVNVRFKIYRNEAQTIQKKDNNIYWCIDGKYKIYVAGLKNVGKTSNTINSMDQVNDQVRKRMGFA